MFQIIGHQVANMQMRANMLTAHRAFQYTIPLKLWRLHLSSALTGLCNFSFQTISGCSCFLLALTEFIMASYESVVNLWPQALMTLDNLLFSFHFKNYYPIIRGCLGKQFHSAYSSRLVLLCCLSSSHPIYSTNICWQAGIDNTWHVRYFANLWE